MNALSMSKKRKRHENFTSSESEAISDLPEVSQKQNRPNSDTVSEGLQAQKKAKRKVRRKSQPMTAWEEAYATDTLAERRARNKAVRAIVGPTKLSPRQIEMELARHAEQQELRKLRISGDLRLERSLHTESQRNEEDDNCEDADTDKSGSDDAEHEIVFVSARATQEAVGDSMKRSHRLLQPHPSNDKASPSLNQEHFATINDGMAASSVGILFASGQNKDQQQKTVVQSIDQGIVSHAPDEQHNMALTGNESNSLTTRPFAGMANDAVTECMPVRTRDIKRITRLKGRRVKLFQEQTGAKIIFVTDAKIENAISECRISGSPAASSEAKKRILAVQERLESKPYRRAMSKVRSDLRALAKCSVSDLGPLIQHHSIATLPRQSAEDPGQTVRAVSETIEVVGASILKSTPSQSGRSIISSQFALSLGDRRILCDEISSRQSLVSSVSPTTVTQVNACDSSELRQRQSSATQDTDGRRSTLTERIPIRRPALIPPSATIIKIEDDSDGGDKTSTSVTNPRQILEPDVVAIFDDHKARNNALNRENMILKYILEYVGVSEWQIERIEKRCNSAKNGRWDGNCLAVLLHERKDP